MGFNSHRVHILVGTFSCIKNYSRKARESELATFDGNPRAVGMLNPMGDKYEGTSTGGEGTTPPVTTACPEDR